MARDVKRLSSHHNDSMNMIFRNLQNENKTSHQLISKLNKTIHVFNQQIANNARGTTYVRWSRKQCPNKNDTELVYAGYTGGGSAGAYGSAPEPVCLPLHPDFNKTSSGSNAGRIFGAEFITNFFASNSAYQDLPCAVCRVKQASSVLMIPGKNRCYKGWNIEYHGYLASSHYSNPGANSYTCIDIQPEFVNDGSASHGDGINFYEVVARCGSLHCPPYYQNYPMTCVVCSK
ncbi:unnamed protein product [Mytilus coruscus]|uniref:Short-chain collagen C4-like n=1 Tax=Mytilus coruscus TaxID=42192 RepID=A0A6J8DY49_MYTCO|nr:unnamed protein product [Mytilus coruscus]